jgi:erythromycin esterase
MKRNISIIIYILISVFGTLSCNRSKQPDNYVANEKELAWLKNNCIQIRTVEAETGFEELQPLRTIIGNSRIVALGEFSHGSHEVFRMKHRLVEFLTTEMGFNIFSLETNMPEASGLNDYVLYGKGDPEALLKTGDGIWNTQEFLEMVNWMRKINSDGLEKIQFTGFDMQYISGALKVLEKFSYKHDNVLKSRIDSIKNAFSRGQLIGPQNPESIQDNSRRESIYELALKINKTSKEIVRFFENNKSSITRSVKESEYQWLMQNANIMVQSSLTGSKNRMTIRDSCMAENVTWLLNSRPDAKIILWAHNRHINKEPGMLGGFLSKKYGNDYFNIGFISNSGTFTASTADGIKSIIMEESKPGSIEYSFHKTKIPIFLFDFSLVNKNIMESGWLMKELNTRFIGSYINKDSMILSQNLSKCYNAIIFIDSTHSSIRLSGY